MTNDHPPQNVLGMTTYNYNQFLAKFFPKEYAIRQRKVMCPCGAQMEFRFHKVCATGPNAGRSLSHWGCPNRDKYFDSCDGFRVIVEDTQ
jgi:hypothetical protein